MIGHLRGKLIRTQPPYLLLEVGGIGYELEAPLSVFYDLPPLGTTLELCTHLHIREDAHTLYAFASRVQRNLFRSLIRINGVGAKMALAILSGMNVEEFARCVREDNIQALVRLPGIGRKTAERLLIEMRDRIEGLEGLQTSPTSSGTLAGGIGLPDAHQDAIAALETLGYKPQEARRLVSAVEKEAHTPEDLIRLALKASIKSG